MEHRGTEKDPLSTFHSSLIPQSSSLITYQSKIRIPKSKMWQLIAVP
jgi:hypothetical protein